MKAGVPMTVPAAVSGTPLADGGARVPSAARPASVPALPARFLWPARGSRPTVAHAPPERRGENPSFEPATVPLAEARLSLRSGTGIRLIAVVQQGRTASAYEDAVGERRDVSPPVIGAS